MEPTFSRTPTGEMKMPLPTMEPTIMLIPPRRVICFKVEIQENSDFTDFPMAVSNNNVKKTDSTAKIYKFRLFIDIFVGSRQGPNLLTLSKQMDFVRGTTSQNKMTRFARYFVGHGPLAPWPHLWI